MKKIIYLIIICSLLVVSCTGIKNAKNDAKLKNELNQRDDLTPNRFYTTHIDTIDGHTYIITTSTHAIDIEHSASCPNHEKDNKE